MGGGSTELKGPDFANGVAGKDVADGAPLLGHVGGEAVVLVRRGDDVACVGATCTHYGGPLAEGIVEGDTIRCPWHHARFDLRTGEAVGAPALHAIGCFAVEKRGDRLFVLGKKEAAKKNAPPRSPSSIVIVGAGAAAASAVEALRGDGYAGPITMVGAEASVPVDRPNLSKDYLAGNAPEEWIPLRDEAYYRERGVDLVTGVSVVAIDVAKKSVRLENGREVGFEGLLYATGAEPVALEIPGVASGAIHTLRSLADSRAIIEAAKTSKRAVVIGASFIGLEVAASLRARGVETHVVAPDAVPLARVLGPVPGAFVRKLHESKGVVFHLGTTVARGEAGRLHLANGETIEADMIVAGVGVRPRVALAEKAGLRVENGVVVDGFLETSAPMVYAAGDVASYPDPYSGEHIRVEHWVVAERQGRVAARNLLGHRETYRDAPFFWSQHYDVPIAYVGHATSWDTIEQHGDPESGSCLWAYKKAGKTLAVATIGLDEKSLRVEAAMERGDRDAIALLVASTPQRDVPAPPRT